MKKVVIIGAGPAGMTAAYSASQNGIDVVLVEKNERVGRKLLITGKGRCNIRCWACRYDRSIFGIAKWYRCCFGGKKRESR